jgi:hypothetical protein
LKLTRGKRKKTPRSDDTRSCGMENNKKMRCVDTNTSAYPSENTSACAVENATENASAYASENATENASA